MSLQAMEKENNKIGAAIQYFRETYQVSQSRLCKGLCSIATLSRIESGERDADSLLLETLLERLGKTPNQFELILTDSDYEAYQKREEIRYLIENKNLEEAGKLLSTYERTVPSKGNVHKQFIVRSKALLNELQGGGVEVTLELLMEAITYTVPDFKTNKIKEYYLSNSELNIIIDIIERMLLMQNISRAKELINQILDHLDKHNSKEKNNILYPKAAILACKLYMQDKEYEKALDLCNKGLIRTKGSKKLDFLGDLYLMKAQATEALQKHKRERNPQECVKLFLQAFHVFKFCEENKIAENIEKYLQEEYQWVCIDWVI